MLCAFLIASQLLIKIIKPNQKDMYYNENDLNLYVKGTDKVVTNKNKSEFYNLKTGRKIRVVRNCRSFGIWNKRKFIPLSKIEIQEEQKNDYSDDLMNLLSQFKN